MWRTDRWTVTRTMKKATFKCSTISVATTTDKLVLVNLCTSNFSTLVCKLSEVLFDIAFFLLNKKPAIRVHNEFKAR